MGAMEAVTEAIKELVLPELASLKTSVERVENRLTVVEKGLSGVEKRLDDVNLHLVDQSRRIDAVREELGGRIDEVTGRIDSMHTDVISRIDKTNDRLNHLYEVIVRRDEQVVLAEKMERLESEVSEIKRKLAA